MLDDAMGTMQCPRAYFLLLGQFLLSEKLQNEVSRTTKIVPRNPRLRITHEQRNFSGKVQGALNDRFHLPTPT